MTPMFDLLQDSGLSLLILLVPTANKPPQSPFSQDPLKNVYAMLILWIFTKDHEFPFKGFA